MIFPNYNKSHDNTLLITCAQKINSIKEKMYYLYKMNAKTIYVNLLLRKENVYIMLNEKIEKISVIFI